MEGRRLGGEEGPGLRKRSEEWEVDFGNPCVEMVVHSLFPTTGTQWGLGKGRRGPCPRGAD